MICSHKAFYFAVNSYFCSMDRHSTVYISLGSNIGNKLQYLQRAVVEMAQQVGEVQAISKVYRTQAWGFDAEAFYNACLRVRTGLSPAECMEKLLQIEYSLGRRRSSRGSGYASRTIDIDIIYFGNEILRGEEGLNIPHLRRVERCFVLQPLCDIAPQFIDPIEKKSVQALLSACTDPLQVIPLSESLFLPQPIHLDGKYIVIEGNIGAGKTSLAMQIAQAYSGRLLLERFSDNPFLERFYAEPQRYGFQLEMSFLIDRYQQVSQELAHADLFQRFVVADYDIFKSLIFASVTLSEEEFTLYRKLFYSLYKQTPKPDLYLYLLQTPEKLLQNIQHRGRSFEQQIPKEYLEDIQRSYLSFLHSHSEVNAHIIDVSELDFVHRESDFRYLLSVINHYKN